MVARFDAEAPLIMNALDGTLTLERINAMCDRTPFFVYPWACNPRAGFGANHSGLTKCLTMSLKKGIGFRLVRLSEPSGIAIDKGYSDYFVPFCGDVFGPFQESLNRSPLPAHSRLPFIRRVASKILRATTSGDARFFLFDDAESIPNFRSDLESVPFDALRRSVSTLLWKYTRDIQVLVDAVCAEVGELRQPYLATCVRRGDKILEADYASVGAYVRHIRSLDVNFSQIFISGDDLPAMETLANHLRNL